MTGSTTGSAEAQSRARYLLEGRRVTIADLLGIGLLKEGERLRFVRPRVGESHEATVTPRGWIRLSDGEEFRSPSKAAMVAVGNGTSSFNGARRCVDGRRYGTSSRASARARTLRPARSAPTHRGPAA
ncbi:hypothetical protein [Streptomyces sp. IBSBF 2390]|uniref:restriction system modified-DNA reader domain-containing protein n=1 Tax=Streptomyces sp. IBSBF 2390 TaxID=2903533 RepID=UPI003FA6C6F8